MDSIGPPLTLTNLLVGSPPLSDPPAVHTDNLDEDDIYRGPDPRSPAVIQPSASLSFNALATRSSTTTSSSSSSSSSSSGMRFNIIPSVIEHAISRWARGRGLRRRGSFSSGTSGSSTSSSSSDASHPRRRRKRSPASIRSHTTSITTRRQARAMSRASPREFILLLPPHLTVSSRYGATLADGHVGQSKRELKTASLELMLAQLAIALKRNAKTQRPLRQGLVPTGPAEEAKTASPAIATLQANERKRKNRDNGPHVAFDVSAHDSASSTPRPNVEARKGKGKLREVPRQFFLQESKNAVAPMEKEMSQSCWWLDVASPTWDDMRALGKLLQLHPLTLEDILQKESREKFELFPRLGYYFVVFRAVERPNTDLAARADDETSSIDGLPELTEVLDVTNIYLVVFKEGICVFHFEDISMHMDAVKKKVLQLEGTIPMGSDWIAHGLMDSIVDAFFPVIRDIEKDVLLVEEFVSILETNEQEVDDVNPFDAAPHSQMEIVISSDTTEVAESPSPDEKNEKAEPSSPVTKSIKKRRPFHQYLALWHHLPDIWGRERRKKNSASTMARDLNRLRRMTATRRLVTTLGRLLSSKAEVIGQIRKRLDGQGEVAIYLGDVLDHIISLHQSLVHYERMLSHTHPAYLSHLRISLSAAKGGMDGMLVMLALVSMLVVTSQIIIGLGSMNVHIPRSNNDYRFFGIFLGLAVLASAAALGLVRYWWVKAHGRRGKMEQI